MPQAICKSCGQPFDFVRRPDAPACVARFKPHMCNVCAWQESEAQRAAEAKAEIAARNVPRRYSTATFKQFVASTVSQRQALEACRDHAGEGVFLFGRAGVGKTLLGVCAAKAGPPGSLFVATTQLLDDIKAGFDKGGHDLLGRAKVAPLLVLDDLGAERITEFAREHLYVLLNERWNHCRSLIVTTNCSPRLIADRISDSVASRIAGMCTHRIEILGEDARRKQVGPTDKRGRDNAEPDDPSSLSVAALGATNT